MDLVAQIEARADESVVAHTSVGRRIAANHNRDFVVDGAHGHLAMQVRRGTRWDTVGLTASSGVAADFILRG